MGYFLDTKTIEKAYKELTKKEVKNPSVLFTFLILKGCNYNNLSFEPLKNITEYGVDLTKRLSWLFAPYEKPTSKSNFINPFNMSEWGSNPKESLEKWVRTRLKNNIIGGATTWRNVIIEDLKNQQIKFTYNYIDEINSLTQINEHKINLVALSIWANRFTQFERKITYSELTNEFLKSYNIISKEKELIFHADNDIELDFSDEPHNASYIRSIIGSPNNVDYWTNVEQVYEKNDMYGRKFEMQNVNQNSVSEKRINELLSKYFQVILSGPPGTSKSYLTSKISDSFDTVTNIQFHPQYSYQQFIGGYIVEKDEVNYRKGLLLNLLEEINNSPSQKSHLLIIDEINRANLSQVFGEIIQCLDRDHKTEILVDGHQEELFLPKNLYIIGTMNSSDRTIGSIDHALRRRFINVYCEPDPNLLIDLCPSQDGISVSDLLTKINQNLLKSHKNRELLVGHANFLDDNVKGEDGKYYWNIHSLELVFNYKVLPMIEEFCYGNYLQIKSVLGDQLPLRLTGDEFEQAIKEFLK
ncbi:5-methylcytosine-specific restriction protein B [Alkalibacillus flavidus]|uniref:5-methylcytosine-specific restriction protein B n=1 Tax=Alkalibacillus flavidus TaxID=546021 RepID=A0ABV2KXY8_9BACI